jgi:hypothetical protein
MNGLDKAVELVLKWTAQRQKDRAEAKALLEALTKDCHDAIQVWQGYLNAPGAAGDQWAVMSWIGPTRAKQLHEINLAAKARVHALGQLAGPAVGRFIDLEPDVIEMGYGQLKPGETGMDAAKTAIKTMEDRVRQLHAQLNRLRTAVIAPDKKPAKSAAAKPRPRHPRRAALASATAPGVALPPASMQSSIRSAKSPGKKPAAKQAARKVVPKQSAKKAPKKK